MMKAQRRRFSPLARAVGVALCALALLGAAACEFGPLAPINPLDPDAPDEIQALATISGEVRAADDAAGLFVNGLRVSGWGPNPDSGSLERLGFTLTDDVGHFSLNVLSRVSELRVEQAGCVLEVVTAPPVAPSSNVTLPAPIVVGYPDTGPISVKGRVVSGGAVIDDAGIEVTLRFADPSGDVNSPSCGAVQTTVTTGEDGVFVADNLPGGEYVAVAGGDGLTVAVSPRVQLRCDDAPSIDDFTFDLLLGSAESMVTLASVDNDVPEGLTRTPQVEVRTTGSVGWATEIRLSEDPTLTTSTGWLPFSDGTPVLYPPNANVVFLERTETVIYTKFKSGCAESPLYASRITYDPDAPFIVSLAVDDVPLSPDPTAPQSTVIVADDRAAVRLAIDALDATGLNVTISEAESDAPNAPFVAVRTLSLDGGEGLIALRDLVSIAPEEGRQRFQLTISDTAGNTLPEPIGFAVLRDLVPPTTPLPATSSIHTTADRVLVWLDERDCALTDGDGNITGYERKLICEENEADIPFQVRGGPQLVDFTGFANAPFVVPVFTDRDTEIEIRAVDAAGNPSISLGTVTVVQTPHRDVFRTPSGLRLKREGQRGLSSAGPTALFHLEPTLALAGNAPSVLVAQSATLPDVGVDPASSVHPEGVRRLTYDPGSSSTLGDYSRWVGSMAAGGGQFSWLEDYRENYRSMARRFLAAPNDNGLYNVADDVDAFNGIDIFGLPAPNQQTTGANEDADSARCLNNGNLICRASDMHSRTTREPISTAALSPRGTYVTGLVGGEVLDTRSEPVVETETITGPALVGVRVGATTSIPFGTLTLRIDVPAGLTLPVGHYYQTAAGDFRLNRGGTYNNATALMVTSGTGYESIMGYDGLFAYPDEDVLMGIVIPSGVEVQVPLAIQSPTFDDEGSQVVDGEHAVSGFVSGFVVAPLSESLLLDDIPLADAELALTRERTPLVQVHALARFAARVPELAGLGVDQVVGTKPSPLPLLENFNAEEGAPYAVWAQDLDRRSEIVSRTVPVASATGIPEDGSICRTVLEVTEPVTLSDIRLRGAGLLDQLSLSLYRRDKDDGVYGAYFPMEPFPNGQYLSRFLYFDAATDDIDVTSCGDVVSAGGMTDVQSAAIPSSLVDTAEVTLPPRMSTDADLALTAGEFVQLSASNVSFPIPVSPNDIVRVFMEQVSGDTDLYVRLGAEPVNDATSWDCRPYGDAVNEVCYVKVPFGVNTLYVGMEGYLNADDGSPAEARVEVTFFDVLGPFNAAAGESVSVRTESDEPIRVFVLQGDLGLLPVDIRSSDYCLNSFVAFEEDRSCDTFEFLAGETYSIAVVQQEPTAVTLIHGNGGGADNVDVQTYAVEAGQRVDVTKSFGEAGLLVGFTYPVTALNRACSDFTTADNPRDLQCDVIVPSGVTAVHVATQAAPAAETATFTTTISNAGCDEVYATRLGTVEINAAQVPLDAGYYIAVVDSSSAFGVWPDDNPPAIESGPAEGMETFGAIRFLGAVGTAGEHTSSLNPINLTTLSNGPVCSLQIETVARRQYSAISVDDAYIAAFSSRFDAQGQRTQRVVRLPVDGLPSDAQEIALSPTSRYLATATRGGRVMWLSANTSETSARIGEWSEEEDFVEETCLNLGGSPVPMRVMDAQFEVDERRARLLVGGAGVEGGEVRLYEADDVVSGCQDWRLIRRIFLGGTAEAVAFSDGDGFAYVTDEFGVSDVVHLNLRDQSELVPGGLLQAVGLGASDTGSVVSLFRNDTQEGRLVHIEHTPLSDSGIVDPLATPAQELGAGKLWYAPRVVGEHLVSVRVRPTDDEPSYALVLRPLSFRESGEAAGEIDDEDAFVVSDASRLFAVAPPFDAFNPLVLAETPLLASDGRFLAVLGFREGGRHIVIYDLDEGADPATMSPALEATDIDIGVVHLSAGHGMVAVVNDDGSSDVYGYDSDLNTFSVWRSGDDGTERVLGATAEGLLVLANIETPSVLRTPTFLNLDVRTGIDPATTVQTRRLPGGTYVHDFVSVASNPRGELFLYDTSASPAVLWRAPIDGGVAVPASGVLRPLAGTTSIADPVAVGQTGITAVRQSAARSAVMYIAR